MKRLNTLLTIGLIGQLALFGSLLAFCGSQPNHVEPIGLLAGIQRDAIDRIEIQSRAGDKTDRIVLQRTDQGWLLPDAHGYPADGGKVDRLLASLVGLQVSRIVAREPALRHALEVTDDTFRRKLILSAGGEHRTLWLGKATSGGATCLRSDDHEETFASAALKPWDVSAQVREWLAQPAFEVDAPKLASIRIQGPSGDLQLNRSDLSGWRLGEEAASLKATDDLLEQLERIEATGVVGKADTKPVDGLVAGAKKKWTITLGLAAEDLPASPPAAPVPDPQPLDPQAPGKPDRAGTPEPPAAPDAPPQIAMTKTIEVFALPDDHADVVVRISGRPHVVRAARYRLAKVLDATAEKLLGKQAQPAP